MTKTNFKSLRDFDLKNKTLLIRADLNVPAKDGRVTDSTRIDRLRPTIDYAVKSGAKIIIMSHFGRPDGKRDLAYSLQFLLPAIAASWGYPVRFAEDCMGTPAEKLSASLKPGEIGVLENLRFYAEEEKNDPGFAKQLAKLGDIYVNDAFSAAHRAHASTEGVAHHLPTAAGFLMEEELRALSQALEHPQRPVMAVAGGSKISTKLKVLNNLVEKVDYLVLGGGMANTFLFAQGADVGGSLCEKDMADEARRISDNAQKRGCKILLPIDVVAAADVKENAPHEIVKSNAIPSNLRAIDAGPESIKAITAALDDCKTIVWNGPLGVFEVKPFDKGTNEFARAVAQRTKAGKLVSIAGGGDTMSALEKAGASDQFTYVSSAGGAFLEWLEGITLPGVAALSAYEKKAA